MTSLSVCLPIYPSSNSFKYTQIALNVYVIDVYYSIITIENDECRIYN